jgi:hypothetical protein
MKTIVLLLTLAIPCAFTAGDWHGQNTIFRQNAGLDQPDPEYTQAILRSRSPLPVKAHARLPE